MSNGSRNPVKGKMFHCCKIGKKKDRGNDLIFFGSHFAVRFGKKHKIFSTLSSVLPSKKSQSFMCSFWQNDTNRSTTTAVVSF